MKKKDISYVIQVVLYSYIRQVIIYKLYYTSYVIF
jgi:hypothetical protein